MSVVWQVNPVLRKGQVWMLEHNLVYMPVSILRVDWTVLAAPVRWRRLQGHLACLREVPNSQNYHKSILLHMTLIALYSQS